MHTHTYTQKERKIDYNTKRFSIAIGKLKLKLTVVGVITHNIV